MIELEAFRKLQSENPFLSMGELVYHYLQQEIIYVRILPGTKLNEAQIAKLLGISRSPVKNAFDILIAEGLLRKQEHRAPVVSPVDTRDSLQICQARMAIEGAAAYQAAKNVTPAEFQHIEKLAQIYKNTLLKEKDVLAAVLHDHNLHTLLVEASHNPYIIEMYRCIQSRALRYRCYLRHLVGESVLLEELSARVKSHSTILAAIKTGMSDIAQAEICYDIDGMRDMFALHR